ncbi:MAG: DUF3810 domain-containing protein [Oscillospiraceae bacterium]|nr:DUF3810 domain-containing protein [Oscillospiraceae bacterium]
MSSMITKERKLNKLCPLRLGVLLVSLLWTGIYFLTRENRAWMNRLSDTLVRPWHRFAGRLYDVFSFSVAELLVILGIAALLCFLVQLVLHFVKRPGDWWGLYRWAVTLGSILAALFALFCLWWGVYYYADSFQEQSGIHARGISTEELERVTAYFVDVVNESAPLVVRDEQGLYAQPERVLFDKSAALYTNVVEKFPCLDGPNLHAKPVMFSIILSYVDCTGVFCPFTAEANLNVHSSHCQLPATIAHELAHQRGVAAEDEANFVAVLSSMESGDADYVYSAALMAYIYLGNALHKADYDVWYALYERICPEARLDLNAHNAYWAQFDTPVQEASNKIYEAFLETYGDDRGMQSYGACVDLLVAYYIDKV